MDDGFVTVRPVVSASPTPTSSNGQAWPPPHDLWAPAPNWHYLCIQVISHKDYEGYELDATTFLVEFWGLTHAAPEGIDHALYLPLHVEGGHANIDRASASRGADRRWTDVGRIRLLGQDQAGPGRSFHRPWDERLDVDSLPGRPFAGNDPVH